MLLTVLRERFKRNTKRDVFEHCFEVFGISFVNLTKILHSSGKLEDVSPDEQNEAFNLENWKRVDKELVNNKVKLRVPIS